MRKQVGDPLRAPVPYFAYYVATFVPSLPAPVPFTALRASLRHADTILIAQGAC